MDQNQMGCCAFNELVNLSECASAREAMLEFCEGNTGEKFDDRKNAYVEVLYLGAFYIFTAIVKCKCEGDCAGTYGHDFAAFIKKNRLGMIKMTMARYNRKNEPDHLIQGWIWAPSARGMNAWWEKNKVKDGN